MTEYIDTTIHNHSLRAIAGALGVSKTTVRNDLQQTRVAPTGYVRGLDGKVYPLPASRYEIDSRRQWIAQQRARGASIRQMANELGVSVGTIHADTTAIRVQVYRHDHLNTSHDGGDER